MTTTTSTLAEGWWRPTMASPISRRLTGGTDVMVYRKDLLEKAGLAPPKTLDEMIADVKKLNDPDNGVYGIALRGARGSGANVWRWMPYFRGFGGKWFDGNTPAFNSDAFVKATQTYLDLFKYSPPGTKTGSWDESTGAFLSGHVALLGRVEPARRLGDRSHDVQGRRQGRLRRAAVSAGRRRLCARLRHRRQGATRTKPTASARGFSSPGRRRRKTRSAASMRASSAS